MSKYAPSLNEIKAIMKCYAEKGTYAAVAREFNISSAIATRIVKENKNTQFAPVIEKYTGPVPLEFPNFNEIVRFYNPSEEWSDSYVAKV